MMDVSTPIYIPISSFEKLGLEVENPARTPGINHRCTYSLWFGLFDLRSYVLEK
jgi:hypothetical protein